MKKIDWMRKLTSRKLWMSVASFVTLMIVACGGTENEATQISALIMAGWCYGYRLCHRRGFDRCGSY